MFQREKELQIKKLSKTTIGCIERLFPRDRDFGLTEKHILDLKTTLICPAVELQQAISCSLTQYETSRSEDWCWSISPGDLNPLHLTLKDIDSWRDVETFDGTYTLLYPLFSGIWRTESMHEKRLLLVKPTVLASYERSSQIQTNRASPSNLAESGTERSSRIPSMLGFFSGWDQSKPDRRPNQEQPHDRYHMDHRKSERKVPGRSSSAEKSKRHSPSRHHSHSAHGSYLSTSQPQSTSAMPRAKLPYEISPPNLQPNEDIRHRNTTRLDSRIEAHRDVQKQDLTDSSTEGAGQNLDIITSNIPRDRGMSIDERRNVKSYPTW